MDFESFTGKQKMRRQKTVRKRKLWARRAGALLTAAAITASLCVPNVLAEEPQQTAQEQTAQSTETQTAEVQSTETQPEAETSTEAKPEADPVAETKPEAEPGTKAQPEEMQNTETQTDSAEAQQTKESAEAQKEEAEAEPETTEKEKVADSAKAAAAASETTETTNETKDGQYDTTKPVIEKVEFPQQGQTLTTKDTLKFYIYAYDADSGIRQVEADVVLKTESGSDWYSMEFTYDETNKRYVGEYSLENVNTDSGYITDIRVIDNSDNYVTWASTEEGTANEKYTFSFQKDDVNYTVKNFVLDQQGKTLKSEDTVSVSFETDPAITEDPGNVNVIFKNENGYSTINIWMQLNPETGKYEGNTQIYNPSGGKWVLDQVGFSRSGDMAEFKVDHPENYWFNTEESEEVVNDKEQPVITSIEVDKNGEVVRAGDKVTIKIKATDNVGLDEYNCYAYMSADQDIVNDSTYVDLQYNEEADAWIGEFVIDENTYPCEWYLSTVTMRDQAGNSADVTKYRSDFYSADPYYVQVMNQNTFVNQTYDGRIYFMAVREDGYWENVNEIEKDNLEKRATFKEAGIEIPEANNTFNGAKQVAWVDRYGNPVDENTLVTEEISYMTVYAKYDKTPVYFWKEYIGQDGTEKVSEREIVMFQQDLTYGELNEYIAGISGPQDIYQGLTFQKWNSSLDNKDDNEIIDQTASVTLKAVYDKNVCMVSYGYLNDKEKWETGNQILTFEQGDTYGDLYEAARNYNPSNPSDQLKIEKFNLSERYLEIYPEDQEISVSPGEILYIRMYADYGEKAVVPISVRYVDENGLYKKINEAAVVDKGISYQDIFEEYIPEKPESYEGLKFKEWDVYIPEGTVQGSDMEISGSAEYSNYLVRFLIDDIFEGEEYIDWNYDDESQDYDYVYCIVAEPGETITLPTKFEGYDSVTWIDQYAWPEDNKLTVDFDITYRGYGEKTATDPSDPEKPVDPEEPTDPEKPVDPEEPSNPEEPSKPEEPSNPGTEIPADTVDSVVQEIEGTSAGSTVQVDMGDATVLSKEILEAAKGKDVNIQLNMGSYTWTINGKDIKASDLKDIDMKVTMNTDAIPSSVVKKLAGDNPTMQLSLAHEGDFGFQAKLTLNVGSQYAGKFGNLYYYDSDGKLVYINSGKVAENGNVSLTFSHASDYVVVLADQQHISKGDGQTGASNTSGNEGTNQGQSGADVVKTGDSAPTVTLLIVMGAAVVVIAGAVIVKKRGSAK